MWIEDEYYCIGNIDDSVYKKLGDLKEEMLGEVRIGIDTLKEKLDINFKYNSEFKSIGLFIIKEGGEKLAKKEGVSNNERVLLNELECKLRSNISRINLEKGPWKD